MMGTQQFRDMFASISCEYQRAFVCNSRRIRNAKA